MTFICVCEPLLGQISLLLVKVEVLQRATLISRSCGARKAEKHSPGDFSCLFIMSEELATKSSRGIGAFKDVIA